MRGFYDETEGRLTKGKSLRLSLRNADHNDWRDLRTQRVCPSRVDSGKEGDQLDGKHGKRPDGPLFKRKA